MTARNRNNPADTFYWKDYDNDKGLRLCSLAAQGLWMRMLCLMAGAHPIGYLKIDGQDITPEDLAGLVGKPLEEVAGLLVELEQRQVFSRNRHRTIYNRRMVLRAKRSKTYAENGKNGAAVTNGKKKENGDRVGKTSGNTVGKEGGKVSAPLPIPLSHTHSPQQSTPQPSDPDKAAAVALIREFDESRTAAFGEAQARPWPAGNDFVTAMAWHEAGVSAALARAVFDGHNAKLAGQHRQPPSSLAFFDRSIREALQRPQPAVTPSLETLDADGRWRLRVQRWRDRGFWLEDWGPKPDQPGTQVPTEILREEKIVPQKSLSRTASKPHSREKAGNLDAEQKCPRPATLVASDGANASGVEKNRVGEAIAERPAGDVVSIVSRASK